MQQFRDGDVALKLVQVERSRELGIKRPTNSIYLVGIAGEAKKLTKPHRSMQAQHRLIARARWIGHARCVQGT
jgi:hypothetical protein